MKTLKITIKLQDWEYEILTKYGYDFEKNAEQDAKNVAYLICVENEEGEDYGTALAREVREQNEGRTK